MRIALCSLTYPLPNGVTNSINTTADGLIANGHEVIIIAPKYGRLAAPARPEHYQIPSSLFEKTFIRIISRKERVFGVNAYNQIKDIVGQFDPDLYWLHSVTYAKNAFERIMEESGKPTVVTYHTHLDLYGRIYGGIVGEQLMIKRSADVCNSMDAVITPSVLMERQLQKFGVSKPIYVIPTGIPEPVQSFIREELCKQFRIPTKNKILLSVGRVVVEKNIFALFRMVADLTKINKEITLLMVGPGDLRAGKAAVKKLGIEKNVIFTGQLAPEITKKCYGTSDMFVFASTTETQGMVVGEAMMAGLPVVAMASEVQEEVYPETVAAIAKTEKDLAPKALELINYPEKAKDMAEKAYKFVHENFSIERMTERQIALFETLVPEKVVSQ